MAELINKYNDNAAYADSTEAAARAALGKSTVSLENDTRVVHYDGVNVEIPAGVCPDVGDALFIDNEGGKHFYSGKSKIVTDSMPSGYEFCGVAAMRRGRKAWILHKDENTSVRFTSCWAWEITGVVYGSSNTIQFQQRKLTSSGASTFEPVDVGPALVFTPTDIDDAVSQIDAHLRTYQGGKAQTDLMVADYNWHCAKIDGRIWVVSDFTSPSYRQYEVQVVKNTNSSNGPISSTNMWTLAGFGVNYTTIQRKDGVTNGNNIWNTQVAKNWMTSGNNNIGSPSDSLTSTGVYRESAWNALPTNSPLKTKYVTYDNYLSYMVPKYPASKLAMKAYYGTSKESCAKMNSVEYVPLNGGNPVKMFTAVSWSSGKRGHSNAQSDGVNSGDWYMPDLDEILGIFLPMRTNPLDPVNATFKQINNSARSLSVSRWVPARSNGGNAWLLPYNGYMTYANFTTTYRACAVALLEF